MFQPNSVADASVVTTSAEVAMAVAGEDQAHKRRKKKRITTSFWVFREMQTMPQ